MYLPVERTKEMAARKVDERLASVEKSIEKIEEQLKLMEWLGNRITECEKVCKDEEFSNANQRY